MRDLTAAESDEIRGRVHQRRRDRSRPSALAWVAGLSLHLAVVLLLV
jgi:hypothetical protein